MNDKQPPLVNAGMEQDLCNRDKAILLKKVRDLIEENYGDELWVCMKAALAMVTCLSLKNRLPITLILEGPSGRGKSTIINVVNPDREETKKVLYRLDKFTPKSFVTHAANVPQKEVAAIDLLPKLRDKVLLVKELAPMFRGRDDELRDNFATLAAVLDGKGHLTASGVYGTRGYEGEYVFNWIGATTPIPPRTDAIMAQLGNRLLRYEIVGKEVTEDELILFAERYDTVDVEQECRQAVNEYLCRHFTGFPVSSIEPMIVTIPKEQVRELVGLAKLIAQGRAEITRVAGAESERDEYYVGAPEGPHRIIQYLRTIAQGLALVSGKFEVTDEDLEVIRHIAFSSIPGPRRKILRSVLVAGGLLSSAQAEAMHGISRPTARAWMKELAATAIVLWTEPRGSEPGRVTLSGEWGWLLPNRQGLDADPQEVEVCARVVEDQYAAVTC